MTVTIDAQPVIIVGAGRSGTNMLRDVLVKLNGMETWPCDEINYIWRHGNKYLATDEFEATNATPTVVSYIRSEFQSMVRKTGLLKIPFERRFLIEKTCANSLRVSFVDKVVPEAKYIFIVRDGRDVVVSANKRWTAPLDVAYIFAKARFVPKTDLFYYAFKYFKNRISKILDKKSTLAFWGPRFQGMDKLLENHGADVVSSHQWVRCVERSSAAFSTMSDERYVCIKYEDMVNSPGSTLKLILEFLDVEFDSTEIADACTSVNTNSVGKSASESELLNNTIDVMRDTLSKYEYI